MNNAYAAVVYAREILRNSQADPVVVCINRDKLRALILAAERSPTYSRDKRLAKALGADDRGDGDPATPGNSGIPTNGPST